MMIHTDKQRELMAARLRRTLFWMKKGPDTPEMQLGVQTVIMGKYWPDWGYPRLYECLVQEFRMSEDQAVKTTREAIINGYEDGKLYGITDEADQPAG
jgi:hypothetical protein